MYCTAFCDYSSPTQLHQPNAQKHPQHTISRPPEVQISLHVTLLSLWDFWFQLYQYPGTYHIPMPQHFLPRGNRNEQLEISLIPSLSSIYLEYGKPDRHDSHMTVQSLSEEFEIHKFQPRHGLHCLGIDSLSVGSSHFSSSSSQCRTTTFITSTSSRLNLAVLNG